MITRNYNQVATITRLAVVDEDDGSTPTNRRTYAAHLANVPCNLQPDTDSLAGGSPGFGKDWLMFCAIQDIIEGDRVTIGSNTYRITGLSKYPALQNRTEHMEINLRLFKS